MSDNETRVTLESINFEFVSSREPKAHNGDGLTRQFFRFRDDEAFPVFIIEASRRYIDTAFDSKLLDKFIQSVPENENLYQSITDGWSKPNRNADINKHTYSFEDYGMTVYYDASKNIRDLKVAASRKLDGI